VPFTYPTCPCCRLAPQTKTVVVHAPAPHVCTEISGVTGWEITDAGLLIIRGPGGILATFRDWSGITDKAALA